LHPSHLLPATGDAAAALKRARIAFFVDTFTSKLGPHFGKLQMARPSDDLSAAAQTYVDNIVKELEPLLEDAKPFFGGSDKITLAEVCLISTCLAPIICCASSIGTQADVVLETQRSKPPPL